MRKAKSLDALKRKTSGNIKKKEQPKKQIDDNVVSLMKSTIDVAEQSKQAVKEVIEQASQVDLGPLSAKLDELKALIEKTPRAKKLKVKRGDDLLISEIDIE